MCRHALAGLVAILLVLCLPTPYTLADPRDAKIDWRQFQGQTLRVLFVAHPWQQAIEPYIPEFEKLTGIKVMVEKAAEDLFWDRSTLGLSAEKPPFDLTYLALGPQGLGAYVNHWIEPLESYLNNAKLTDEAWYRPQEFYPAYLKGFRLPAPDSGQLHALPISGEVYINFYRKDLFAQKRIAVSELRTMDDWLAVVRRFSREGGGSLYGATIRGADVGIVDELNAMVLNYWGSQPYLSDRFVYFNESWQPRFTDSRIVGAFEVWSELMKNSPPGVTSFSWYEATSQFAQGRAATFWADASLFAPMFEDAAQSRIVGKVGYAPLPATANGNRTTLFSWGLAIASKSEKKGPAWLFIQWATSPEMDLKVGAKTWAATRQSSWQSSEMKANMPPGFAETVAASLAIAEPSIMYLASGPEVIMRMIDALHSLYQDQATSTVMSRLNLQVTDILRRDGLLKK